MKTITWPSLLAIGIALLLWCVIKFTLDPFENAGCVLDANIEAKTTGAETLSLVFVTDAFLPQGGYHLTTDPEDATVKAVVEGYRVTKYGLPPMHAAVLFIQNAAARYAVETSGI